MRLAIRGRRRAVTLAAVAALTAAGLVPVAPTGVAAPAPDDPAPAPAVELDGVPAGPQQVTLITGDKVFLDESGTGRSVRVEAAPRPNGGPLWFRTMTEPDGVYVLPSDAQQAIGSGRLDKELFNVEYLAANGYTDAATGRIPVLVSYPAGRIAKPSKASLAGQADQLAATSAPVGLTSINGAGVQVDKQAAEAFWEQVRGGSAVGKVWLNQKVKVDLAESVPLIGAPDAWNAGYDGKDTTVAVLDTGIDANHPDVAGKVVGSKDFTGKGNVVDGNGHGTHVAATIAGSGAASGGSRKGVAPGAHLLVGKVLSDAGNGDFAGVIAGMEWAAAEQHADVISMSLGACCSDGTDPASIAVDNLTASTGTLFVIAAGNDGPKGETISSPGSANAALTVAATSKQDTLAGFSSRGPRPGDLALKPDLAAPGVDIIAARAAGTTLGTPVDANYTKLSGTSMATPHVAGSAAILVQEHPDWTPAQLKAALMSSAKDVGNTVYQVGAGRVDVARATRQQVFATTANLDFGLVEKAPEGTPTPPVSKQVTYTNLSGQPVTLTLGSSLHDVTGAAVPAGTLTSEPTVTVPAGGTATTTVTVAPGDLAQQLYTGALVGTDEATGTRVTTPIGVAVQPKKYNLTVRTLGRNGLPATPEAQDVIDVTGPNGADFSDDVRLVDTGVTRVSVFPGTYSIAQLMSWVDGDNRLNGMLLVDPEVTVTKDTEITLDARKAGEITFDTPRPGNPLNNVPSFAYQRTNTAGQTFGSVVTTFQPIGSWVRLWATPTERVRTGQFRFWSQFLFGKAEVAMTMRKPYARQLPIAVPLHGIMLRADNPARQIPQQDYHPGWVPFTGTRDLGVVDVGDGTPQDLAKVDARGKLALLETGKTEENRTSCGLDVDRLAAVRAAGAVGVIAYPAPDHKCPTAVPIPLQVQQKPFTGEARPVGIPNVALSTQEGVALRHQLTTKPVVIRTEATPETPYTYALKPYEEGRIPKSLRYTMTAKNLGHLRLDYHAATPTNFIDYQYINKIDDAVQWPIMISDEAATSFVGPHSYTEYFGPVSREVFRNRGTYGRQGGDEPEGYTHRVFRATTATLFAQPDHDREQWYAVPRTPGVQETDPAIHRLIGPERPLQGVGNCYLCRQGNILWAAFTMTTGTLANRQNDGGSSAAISPEEGTGDFDVHLYKGDQEVPKIPAPWPVFSMPNGPATYKMTATGTQTDVTWTFTSDTPAKTTHPAGYLCLLEAAGSTQPCAPEPMVFASYDLGRTLTMTNKVPDQGTQRFTVHAYHSDSTVPMPAISGVKLWVSYDHGALWRPATVRAQGGGDYTVTVDHPPARKRATDQVSLRVEAWDAAGNRIEQVTRDAFTLS